jgi:hypothetical protein
MKINLHSDFTDYYDDHFDKEGTTFDRLYECGPHRREMYALLEQAGYCVPRHGTVEEVAAHLIRECQEKDVPMSERVVRQMTEVVVYSTEREHGADNHLVSIDDALTFFPGHYCTEYIRAQTSGLGWTLQYLQIGERHWWLSYTSSNNWRSNVGDAKVEVIEEGPRGYHGTITEPLFAIDFVPAQKLYAIDYNIGPKLADTGIEVVLPPGKVIELICASLTSLEKRQGQPAASHNLSLSTSYARAKADAAGERAISEFRLKNELSPAVSPFEVLLVINDGET